MYEDPGRVAKVKVWTESEEMNALLLTEWNETKREISAKRVRHQHR